MSNIAKVDPSEKIVGHNKTIIFYFQNTHKRLRTMTALKTMDQVNNLGSEGQVADKTMSMIKKDRLKETETEAELSILEETHTHRSEWGRWRNNA